MSGAVMAGAVVSGDGSAQGYVQALNLVCGALLLSAVLILWRREMAAIVRLLAVQGCLVGALAAVLGAHQRSFELAAVAVGLIALKGVLLPVVLDRARRADVPGREADPLVNVPASLVAAALLTLLAYVASRPLTTLAPTAATAAIPVGLAMVLIGLFTLATRRNALPQVAGFLVLDNGIGVVALLATGGVPLIVELGAALDLLLLVLVLQVLTTRLRITFGGTDLDELRELRD
jgi:hydrogenase-4 component E